jgi:hypothetical protein
MNHDKLIMRCPIPPCVPSHHVSHPTRCPIPAGVPSQQVSHPTMGPIPPGVPSHQVSHVLLLEELGWVGASEYLGCIVHCLQCVAHLAAGLQNTLTHYSHLLLQHNVPTDAT